MLNFRAKGIKCLGLLKTKWKFFLYVLQLGKQNEFLLLVLYKCTSQQKHFFKLGSLMPNHKLTNRQQFSMICTLIDHRNDIWIFKTQVEPRTTGELLQCKVLNILTSCLYSIRVLTMENCCRIVFHNNVNSFDVHFCWGFSENRAHKLRHYDVIPMVCT